METNNHIKAIDQLRGMAILLVLANHTFGYAEARYPMPFARETSFDLFNFTGFVLTSIFSNGFFGVMLFFVLSGFCIRWSHLNTRDFSWSDFYNRRFFRIFPAYWFWLVVAAVLTIPSIWDFVFHAILAHNAKKEYFHSIYPPFWSIAIEWQIYLIYPILLWVSTKVQPRILLIGLAAVGVGSTFISSPSVEARLGTDSLSFLARLPTALLFSWMLGFYLAESLKQGRHIQVSPILLIASLSAGVLAYSHPYTCFLASVPWSYAAYQIVAFSISNTRSSFTSLFEWMAPIGVISYSVYLSHDLFVAAYPFISKTCNLPKGTFVAGILTMGVLILPMLLIGFISYRLIEVPGTRLGKKFLTGKKRALPIIAD